MEPLRIGTCSWRYPSWAGLVYRDGKGSGVELLAEYATRYDTVEIDRWFWSLGRTRAMPRRTAGQCPWASSLRSRRRTASPSPTATVRRRPPPWWPTPSFSPPTRSRRFSRRLRR